MSYVILIFDLSVVETVRLCNVRHISSKAMLGIPDYICFRKLYQNLNFDSRHTKHCSFFDQQHGFAAENLNAKVHICQIDID